MSIEHAYQTLLADGQISADPAQARAVGALVHLARELAAPTPAAGFWGRLLAKSSVSAPRGLYIHGPVGRGKSMLMDLFFEAVAEPKKRRVHFHAFMLEVHDRIHIWRQQDAGDALAQVATDIAAETRLLCFDEFQVVDVADAMILGRLFSALFAAGVVMVATSNTAPDNLYKDGLQRALFLPFIALLQQRCAVIEVAGEKDYRRLFRATHATYLVPCSAENRQKMEDAFLGLTRGETGRAEPLMVKAHRLEVPRAAHGVAWFGFADLCKKPLGTVDFRLLASRYPTFFISDVVAIGAEESDVARRFITLIDMLYEYRCKLVMLAAVRMEEIYPAGVLHSEFARCLSRLHEMQSEAWWEQPHRSALEDEGAA